MQTPCKPGKQTPGCMWTFSVSGDPGQDWGMGMRLMPDKNLGSNFTSILVTSILGLQLRACMVKCYTGVGRVCPAQLQNAKVEIP